MIDPFATAVRGSIEADEPLRLRVLELVPTPKNQILIVRPTSEPPVVFGARDAALCESCGSRCWISPSTTLADLAASTVLCEPCLGWDLVETHIRRHLGELIADGARRLRGMDA